MSTATATPPSRETAPMNFSNCAEEDLCGYMLQAVPEASTDVRENFIPKFAARLARQQLTPKDVADAFRGAARDSTIGRDDKDTSRFYAHSNSILGSVCEDTEVRLVMDHLKR